MNMVIGDSNYRINSNLIKLCFYEAFDQNVSRRQTDKIVVQGQSLELNEDQALEPDILLVESGNERVQLQPR